MSSNYALYVKEREDKEIIEDDKGFVTYLELDKSKTIYISDVFIRKEYRGTGVATQYYNKLLEIAKEKEYVQFLTSVDTATNNWEHSKTALEGSGFQVSGNDNTLIFLIKDIRHGW